MSKKKVISPKTASILGLSYGGAYNEDGPLLPMIEWEKPTRIKTGKREEARRRKQAERKTRKKED